MIIKTKVVQFDIIKHKSYQIGSISCHKRIFSQMIESD